MCQILCQIFWLKLFPFATDLLKLNFELRDIEIFLIILIFTMYTHLFFIDSRLKTIIWKLNLRACFLRQFGTTHRFRNEIFLGWRQSGCDKRCDNIGRQCARSTSEARRESKRKMKRIMNKRFWIALSHETLWWYVCFISY